MSWSSLTLLLFNIIETLSQNWNAKKLQVPRAKLRSQIAMQPGRVNVADSVSPAYPRFSYFDENMIAIFSEDYEARFSHFVNDMKSKQGDCTW